LIPQSHSRCLALWVVMPLNIGGESILHDGPLIVKNKSLLVPIFFRADTPFLQFSCERVIRGLTEGFRERDREQEHSSSGVGEQHYRARGRAPKTAGARHSRRAAGARRFKRPYDAISRPRPSIARRGGRVCCIALYSKYIDVLSAGAPWSGGHRAPARSVRA
jgi:hypothetical protein